MTLICPSCGLPDQHGTMPGDGVTTCDCPHCLACGGCPDDCVCENAEPWDQENDL